MKPRQHNLAAMVGEALDVDGRVIIGQYAHVPLKGTMPGHDVGRRATLNTVDGDGGVFWVEQRIAWPADGGFGAESA